MSSCFCPFFPIPSIVVMSDWHYNKTNEVNVDIGIPIIYRNSHSLDLVYVFHLDNPFTRSRDRKFWNVTTYAVIRIWLYRQAVFVPYTFRACEYLIKEFKLKCDSWLRLHFALNGYCRYTNGETRNRYFLTLDVLHIDHTRDRQGISWVCAVFTHRSLTECDCPERFLVQFPSLGSGTVLWPQIAQTRSDMFACIFSSVPSVFYFENSVNHRNALFISRPKLSLVRCLHCVTLH